MVNNRLAAMLAIINLTVHTGNSTCTVPINKLCLKVLRAFRYYGYIGGLALYPLGRDQNVIPSCTDSFKYIIVRLSFEIIRVYKNTVQTSKLFKW